MRLIDGDALRECYTDLDDNLKVPVAICKANIDSMPTIEAEPIKMMCNGDHINCPAHKDYERGFKDGQAEPKHGRWIWRGGNLYECSECEAIVVAQDYIPIELHKFCRGCGAKMDGGENDYNTECE